MPAFFLVYWNAWTSERHLHENSKNYMGFGELDNALVASNEVIIVNFRNDSFYAELWRKTASEKYLPDQNSMVWTK